MCLASHAHMLRKPLELYNKMLNSGFSFMDGISRLFLTFFIYIIFNCGKMYNIKFTILAILKCSVQ